MGGPRADAYLAEKGFFPSRAQARAAILAGEVTIDGAPVAKAGERVREGATVKVKERPRYVSRGGDKLEGALAASGIDVRGLRVLDAGASTGGFTDCLLVHGAREVVAVDVGYGQFAWRLRTDPRVRLLERTNVRDLGADDIGGPCDLAVADLSFISLKVVLPALFELVVSGGPLLVLFKPQFEAGRGRVAKGGVIRDPALHVELLRDFAGWSDSRGYGPVGLWVSEPRGSDGNVEFFWHLASGATRRVEDADVERTVRGAAQGDDGSVSGPGGRADNEGEV